MQSIVTTELFSGVAKIPSVIIVIIIVFFLVLGGVGIGLGLGIGMALRDIPKYIALIVISILNFILLLLHRQQINIPPEYSDKGDSADTKKRLRLIKGGKTDKQNRLHEDKHT